jgi:GNAT superfamily N-acetyltransferase
MTGRLLQRPAGSEGWRINAMPEQPLRIRSVCPEDAALVADHRARMFLEMGKIGEDAFAGFRDAVTPILRQVLTEASYHGWLVTRQDGSVVGGAGVLLRLLLPRPDALKSLEALVVNVYVEPAYRRRGVARALMKAVLDWCRGRGIGRIVLHPSASGKPLYDSLGFVPTGELVYRPS